MTTFMQIVTLQNSTFNGWAWVIGTIILLIIVGMTIDEDPSTAVIFAACALFWPMFVPVFVFLAIVSLPVLLGRKIKTFLRNKV